MSLVSASTWFKFSSIFRTITNAWGHFEACPPFLAKRKPHDLQVTRLLEWAILDLNQRPPRCQSDIYRCNFVGCVGHFRIMDWWSSFSSCESVGIELHLNWPILCQICVTFLASSQNRGVRSSFLSMWIRSGPTSFNHFGVSSCQRFCFPVKLLNAKEVRIYDRFCRRRICRFTTELPIWFTVVG